MVDMDVFLCCQVINCHLQYLTRYPQGACKLGSNQNGYNDKGFQSEISYWNPQNAVKTTVVREYQVQYWLLWTLLHIDSQVGVNYNTVSPDFDVKV